MAAILPAAISAIEVIREKAQADIAAPAASVRITPSATKIVDWEVKFVK